MQDASSSGRTSTHGFLFADLRDYSRFVETHGDVAAAGLLTTYRTLVREVVARHEGAEVKTEGDSFYVVFPSASAAVRCGMEILEAARAAAAGPIQVGIGVHAGETAETQEGFVGSAVNIAARVCARAAAGELLVTETVRFLTRTLVPYSFVARGNQRLKGIDEPIPLFRVTESPAGGRPHRGRQRPVAPMVAVGALALVLVGLPLALIASGNLGRAPASSTTPSPSGGASSTATGSPAVAASGALTPEEQDLVARLPLDIRGACAHSPPTARVAGSRVSVTCPLSPDANAESVTWNLFDQAAALRSSFEGYLDRQGISSGDCSTESKATGPWSLAQTFDGRLLCYQDGAVRTWIVWTYERGQGEGILAVASRHDTNWRRLYDWWRNTAYFLSH